MSGFITIKRFQVTPSAASPSGYASLFLDTDNRLKLMLDDGTIFVYGLNNYELAVSEGFTGTLQEYLESLHGESAYQLWLSLGNSGSEQYFLNSLKGTDGTNGIDGNDGTSAYQTWLNLGNTGTEQDFIDSLKGSDGFNGDNGLSSYQIWLNQGNIGSEQDFLDSLRGSNGTDGTNGDNGISAYQSWLNLGNTGSEQDFIDSLHGLDGTNGLSAYELWLNQGNEGDINYFLNSLHGADGLSAYELWLNNGNTGTEQDFLASLNGTDGVDGTNGIDGTNGTNGTNGLSAYEIWLNLGNTGTEQDFIDSLKGADGTSGGGSGFISQETAPTDTTTYKLWFDTTTLKLKVFVTEIGNYIDAFPIVKGDDGASAYQTWLSLGNSGTEADFLASLKGADGVDGTNGTNGTGIPAGGSQFDVLQKTASATAWYSIPVFKGLYLTTTPFDSPFIGNASYAAISSHKSTIGYRAGVVSSNNLFEYIQGALSHKSIRAILPVVGAGAVNNIGIQSPNVAGSITAYTINTNNTAYNKMGPVEAIATASTNAVAGFYQAVSSIARVDNLGTESIRITLEFGVCSGASNTNKQMFIGISNNNGAPTDVDPSTLLNTLGFGFSTADTSWNLIARGTGSVTKVATGISKPNADRSVVYRVIIESVGGNLSLSLEEVSTSATKNIYQTSSTQTFPFISTMMSMRGYVSAGGTSAAMGIGMFKMLIEEQIIS